MKNLKISSLFVMFIILLQIGCRKDDSFVVEKNEISGFQQFLNISDAPTRCQSLNPKNPPFRIKLPDSVAIKRNLLIEDAVRSGTFHLNQNFIEEFGNPVAEISLFVQNDKLSKAIVPTLHPRTGKITSFFEISKDLDRGYSYKFNNREYHDYYFREKNHKNRPSQNRLNLNNNYYQTFDYAVCQTDAIPVNPVIDPNLDETPICVENVVLWKWEECMAVVSGQTESREDCGHWENPEIYQIEVPCPGGAGGSGDGGGTGDLGGPGGNGSGGNGNTGGSQTTRDAKYFEDLGFISHWLDDDVFMHLWDIIDKSDKSDDCLAWISGLKNTLKNNNYSQAAIQTVNCIGAGINLTVHPSAPDDCNASLETSAQNILNNFNNFPPLIYGVTIQNTPLAKLPCELANSQLTMTQITNLVNAIDNFLPDNQNQGLGVEGGQGSGTYPGTQVSYEWIADELVDLMTAYPQLNFDQADMEWLMNNYYSSLQKIKDFLNSKQNKTDATSFVNRINNLRNTEPDIRWDRSLEFYNVLESNPNVLTACGNPPANISDWSDLASFVPPANVISKLTQLGEGWRIQGFQTPTTAPSVNLDYFSTTILEMPINPSTGQPWSPDAFFQHIRKNINNFVDTDLSNFEPIPSDQNLWLSNNPVSAAIHINIFGPDDGSVICAQSEPCCWIFSTVKAPTLPNFDGFHPVSGNRQFGYKINSTGTMEIYTKGADRFFYPQTPLWGTDNLAGYMLEKLAFSQADKLWESFQKGILDYVTKPQNGGQAYITPGTKNRPKAKEALKQLLKQGEPITHIPCGN